MRIPGEKVFAVYERDGRVCSLAELIENLFRSQLETWELLATNHAALNQVETRTLVCGDEEDRYEVAVQWNPRRIQSTGAQIDRSAPRASACFLCLVNLPPEQKGVLYEERFLFLCNPMPIFDRHFTIADIRHVPQLLAGSIQAMLDLARDLGPMYAVFYNGAWCGASAPDHLHFQACPVTCLPDRRIVFSSLPDKKIGDTAIYMPSGMGRPIVFMKGREGGELAHVINLFLNFLKADAAPVDEPMVNVIVSRHDDGWLVAVYPRWRHRPLKYDAPAGERLMVSPGAVDMSGVIIMPIEEEFRRICADDIRTIYNDVVLDDANVRTLVRSLTD